MDLQAAKEFVWLNDRLQTLEEKYNYFMQNLKNGNLIIMQNEHFITMVPARISKQEYPDMFRCITSGIVVAFENEIENLKKRISGFG